jgi:hypothetical protein
MGKLRPDFRDRCQPVSNSKWPNIQCQGDKKVINEGRKSFPSGHTSSILILNSSFFFKLRIFFSLFGWPAKFI